MNFGFTFQTFIKQYEPVSFLLFWGGGSHFNSARMPVMLPSSKVYLLGTNIAIRFCTFSNFVELKVLLVIVDHFVYCIQFPFIICC